MKVPDLKSILISILGVMVLAQGAWIIGTLSGESTIPQVSSVQVLPGRAGVEVKFSVPISLGELALDAVGSLSPEAEGTWMQTEADELRFVSEGRLAAHSAYELTLSEGLPIEGERIFTFETSRFNLRELKLDESAGTRPGTTIIVAQLKFNDDVAPEDLAGKASLVNEVTGEQIRLQVMSSWRSRYMELQSEEVKKTTDGATYRLTVHKGLTLSDSPVALKEDVSSTIELRLDPELRLESMRPNLAGAESGVRLVFSTPVTPDAAASFLRVTPEVQYSIASDGSDVLLSGGFKPGARYEVSVRQGLVAADGAVLGQGKSVQVTIPDLAPAVRFVGNGLFLPRSRAAGLVVEAVNTRTVDIRLDRVYPNNLFTMLRQYGWKIFDEVEDYYSHVPDAVGGRLEEQSMPVSGKVNEWVRLPLDLSNILENGKRGLYKIGASLPDEYGVKRWLLLTDIGLVAKRDANGFYVWAVSHESLAPLAGVRLTLVSDKNQNLAKGVTGINGSARLPLPKDEQDGTAYMILAEKGDDFSFLLPSRFGVDTTGLEVAGVTTGNSGLRAFIYGERDLYRPGETVQGMVVVRNSKLAVPAAMPMVLKRYDPKGREVGTMRLSSDPGGTVAFTLPLQPYALTGTHSLTLSAGGEDIGSYDFKVEEFLPDRIKVEVKTGKDVFSPGEKVAAEIRSSYLFGPPAADLPVTVRALLRPAPFTATGYADYVFGDSEREFEPQEVFVQDEKLDAQGGLQFSFGLPSSLRPPSALEAVILGRVSESGGRGVTARKRVVVHPYAQYVGLRKLGKSGYEPGTAIPFDFAVVTPDGKPAAYSGLKARLYKDRYRSVIRQTPSGGYRYESVNDPQLLVETALESGQGKGRVVFTPPGYGSYSVVIVAAQTGTVARASFYCGGWGYSPWAIKNPARVDLVPDKAQYIAGETAVIQIRTPFAGRVLIAVEGDAVHDTRVINLKGNTGEVRFPVKAGYAPNVHVTAMLLRKGADVGEGGVGRAFGAIPLLVDNLSNKLPVTVSGPAEVRPEAELTLEVKARPGAVVTLAAVDEGIMQLSGTADPAPFDFFYARRGLGVKSFDTFSMLYPDFARLLGEAEAGGGLEMAAESQFMRTEGIRRVHPVSFWSGPLVADKQGMVRHTVQLPDFQGALRVVAVGVDGKRFGTGRTMVRVRSPLAVTPTLPRFLATGDSMEMPVTVRNDTGDEGTFEVRVTVQGAVEAGDTVHTLTLADGTEETVYFPVTATVGAGGDATITVIATGGGETRRVVTALPVRPALPYTRAVAYGTLTDTGGEMVPAAQGMVAGTVSRTIALGGLPITRFAGKLEYLLRYPYGCAEQTTSKAFPLIRFGSLAAALAPHLVDEKSAPQKVQSAILRLGSMQARDGGFAYWPGGEESSPWVSAYVTHFLLEASQAGYGTPWMLPAALDYLRHLGRKREELQATTYALYVLAKAGRQDRGSMDELRDKRIKQLKPAARTLLACAYAQLGDRKSFSQLLGTLPEVAKGRAADGSMSSGLTDASLMLLTLADVDMSDPLVGELARTVSSRMVARREGTTLENGLAFAALGKVLNNAQPEPFSGELLLGAKTFPFSNVQQVHQDGVLESGAIRATISSDTKWLYWSVTTRGVPELAAYKALSNGLEVQRSFLSRDGTPLEAASLEQGQLVLMKTELRSTKGALKNVVVQALLPAGLEVENPRLGAQEMAFHPEGERFIEGHQDVRDDRVLFFTDMADDHWYCGYTQLRAVVPGTYALPPVQAEAMYDPAVVGSTEPGRLDVVLRP